MADRYRSEIRDGTIRDLLEKVRKQNFGQYVRRIRLNKVRAFKLQEVSFDFPVTALIGTNGGGKSTILGCAAMAYKPTKPATHFPKSSIGDKSMENWNIGYDLIEKTVHSTQPAQRSARFKQSRWARDDLVDRPVFYFGIQRTVPAGEKTEFKKFATFNYQFEGERRALQKNIQEQAARILGKDMAHFQEARISDNEDFYIGGDGSVTYSEFHFGAGESSVIRMVGKIEVAPKNSLVLIEEIENGLHPVAVRKMVEYLVDAADRKSIQTIFTTHSNDALAPLPPEAIWSAIDGKVRQGRVSIEALRAITGKIEESAAIFVEDEFARDWVEAIVRRAMPDRIDEIGVYSAEGDSQAFSIHASHRKNPAVKDRLRSICILDGDSAVQAGNEKGVIRLPGAAPNRRYLITCEITLTNSL